MNILEILEDSRLGLSPDSTFEQIKLQFTSYLHLLVKWNKKINLTSEKTNSCLLITPLLMVSTASPLNTFDLKVRK